MTNDQPTLTPLEQVQREVEQMRERLEAAWRANERLEAENDWLRGYKALPAGEASANKVNERPLPRPTATHLALLAEMTIGGATLHAYPTPRRTTSHHYVLRGGADDVWRTISSATVEAMRARGLIVEVKKSIYSMEWTYRVTAAGIAAANGPTRGE